MFLIGFNAAEVVLAADADLGKSPHRLGEIAWHQDDEGIKCYKWVEYREGGAAVDSVALEFAYYYTVSGYTNHLVTSDVSASGTFLGAGVVQAALSEGDQGWVQIKGPATLSIALDVAIADGDPCTPVGAADGSLDVVTGVTDHVCAYAVDASAETLILDCPF